nr:hypothetical protein, conserved [Leishmania guyanensis]
MWPSSTVVRRASANCVVQYLSTSFLPCATVISSPASLSKRRGTSSMTRGSQTIITDGGSTAFLQARRYGSAKGRAGQARGTRGAATAKADSGAAGGKAATSSSQRAQPVSMSARHSSTPLRSSLVTSKQVDETAAFFDRGNSSRDEAAESVDKESEGESEGLCPSPSARWKRASLRAMRGRDSVPRLAATEARDDADEMDDIGNGGSDEFSEPPTEDPVVATLHDEFGGSDELERDHGERRSRKGTETCLDGVSQAEEYDGAALTRRLRRRSLTASAADTDAGDADATSTASLPAELLQRTADSAVVDEEMANRYLALAFPELAAEYAAAGDGANTTPVSEVMTDSAVVAAWRCSTCNNVWRSGVFVRCILKNGCPQCAANRTSTLAKMRPDLLQLWDYNRNNPFLKPEEIAADSKQSVFWRCPMCRESYAARVKDRALDKVRCSSCALLRSQSAGELASEESVVLQEWHPLKNGDLRIEQLSPTDTRTKVWWLCAGCGHEWEASLAARLTRGRLRKRSLCPACHGKGVTELLQ